MKLSRVMLLTAVAAGGAHGNAGASAPSRATQSESAAASSRARLLAGVRGIASPGVPGALSVWGPRAFAVVAGNAGKDAAAPVVAAAAGTPIVTFLKANNLDAEELAGAELDARLPAFDVFLIDPRDVSDAGVAAIDRYIKSGGGVLMAGLGWGWLQTHSGKQLHQYPANRILQEAGLYMTDGTVSPGPGERFEAGEPPFYCHAGRAIERLAAHMVDMELLHTEKAWGQ